MMNPSHELDDPATTAERLQQIALEHPELGARIAAHPNCYPELSEWVDQHALAHHVTGPQVEPVPRPRKLLKGFGIAAAIVVPLITAVSITVPVIAGLSEKQSSPETLSIKAALDPFADTEVIGEVSGLDAMKDPGFQPYWKVPVDAPMGTFPMPFKTADDGTAQCSEEQTAWLHEHAEPAARIHSEQQLTLSLHNGATGASSLALGNIRFVGQEAPSTPSVYMNCDADQRGAVGGVQPMMLDMSGSEAVYGEALQAYGDNLQPAGSPVTLNLGAGEAASIVILRAAEVDRQRAYEGRIVADVLDGSGGVVTLAEHVTFARDHLGDGFRIGAVWAEWDTSGEFGALTCIRGSSKDTCTPAQAAEFLREAAASIEDR